MHTRLSILLSLALVSGLVPSLRAQDDAKKPPVRTQGAVAGPAIDREAVQAALQKALDALHERAEFPGGSFALVLPDRSLVAVTVGMSSVEDKAKMRAKDRMMAGSVGKTYFAAAALHLAKSGKLELDSKVVDHLGKHDWYAKVPNAKTITVRTLLNHSAGIPRYVFKQAFWKTLMKERDKVWKPHELLAFVAGDAPLFDAGKGWAYADTNYILLGMVLEKVSGTTVYKYVQKHLLDPHKLRDTVPSDRRKIPGLVQGYCGMMQQLGMPERVLEDGKFVVNPQFEWCGGGYVSTPSDLARWARLLWTGKAFEGQYLEEMLKTVKAERYFGRGSGYGLGTIVRKTQLGDSLGHDGVFPGYATSIAWFPEAKMAAALQINKDGVRETKVMPHRELVRLVALARKALMATAKIGR